MTMRKLTCLWKQHKKFKFPSQNNSASKVREKSKPKHNEEKIYIDEIDFL